VGWKYLVTKGADMERTIDATINVKWKTLIRVGGIAPLIALLFYLMEFSLVIIGEYPTTVEEWFLLIQRSKILGLLYLNVLDIFSISMLGIMFLALYIVLRGKNNSLMAISTYFAILGVAIFSTTRIILTSSTLSLLCQMSRTEPYRTDS
jgi:hypothetical protein